MTWWEADDICILKVIKIYFSFTALTFLKFLFCEWFVAFYAESLICICKLMKDGVVNYLYCNNGLPCE